MVYTRLPKSVAASLKFKKQEVSPLAKARVHERKAEKLRKDDEKKPYLEFIERWKALEHSVAAIKKKASRELILKLSKDPSDHLLLGHLIAQLPKARLDMIFKDPRIKDINVMLAKRNPAKLVDENMALRERGIRHATYLNAKRDLKFNLGLQAYKSSQAIALYLSIIRWAVERSAKRSRSLMSDDELLDVANGLMRDIVTHIIEDMQLDHDAFYDVGDRATRTGGGILARGRPVVPGRKV